MSSSFTTVYLIRYIKLDMGTISLINVVTTGVILLTNRFWSNIESSRGYTFVVGRTTLLLAGELLVLSFVNGNFLTLPLLFISAIIAGAGNGGFIIAVLTYRYEIMPSDNKTLHEGWYYFAFGIGTLGGPFAGKLLMNFIPVVKNIIYQYSNFQLLYLLSAVILMLLAYVSFFRPGCTARE
jgi:MFS family permease